jgi:hypothetical protein
MDRRGRIDGNLTRHSQFPKHGRVFGIVAQPLSTMAAVTTSVLCHVVDVHCHPTDAPTIAAASMEKLQIRICAMATTQSDQDLVRDLADKYPEKVIPCFGQPRVHCCVPYG